MNSVTTYKTLETPSNEVLYKDKGSKFFGYAFPIKTKEENQIILDARIEEWLPVDRGES